MISIIYCLKNIYFQYRIHCNNELWEYFLELYLTEREKDVIQLICEGYSNAEIATVLFISKHTVKRHVLSILNKLSAKTEQMLLLFMQKV